MIIDRFNRAKKIFALGARARQLTEGSVCTAFGSKARRSSLKSGMRVDIETDPGNKEAPNRQGGINPTSKAISATAGRALLGEMRHRLPCPPG